MGQTASGSISTKLDKKPAPLPIDDPPSIGKKIQAEPDTMPPDWQTYLPAVKGSLIAQAPLAPASWFRVGGAADRLFLPHNIEDLSQFLAQTPSSIPISVLGAASNTLIRDGGIKGITIRLVGAHWGQIETGPDQTLWVGAGTPNRKIARFAAKNGMGGLEFLSGIPGMAGGAVVMNAGCHGRETKDVFVSCRVMDRQGQSFKLTPEQLDFSYRHARIPDGIIIVSVCLQTKPDAPQAIIERIARLQNIRETSQPIRERTGGSSFANPDPPGTPNQCKAWQLLDAAGMRGQTYGGAQFSEKHCNFLINTGKATAQDLETLGEMARQKVKAQSGIDLRWEIRRIGRPLAAKL